MGPGTAIASRRPLRLRLVAVSLVLAVSAGAGPAPVEPPAAVRDAPEVLVVDGARLGLSGQADLDHGSRIRFGCSTLNDGEVEFRLEVRTLAGPVPPGLHPAEVWMLDGSQAYLVSPSVTPGSDRMRVMARAPAPQGSVVDAVLGLGLGDGTTRYVAARGVPVRGAR